MKKRYLLIITAIITVSILIVISIMLLLRKQYDDSLSTDDLYSKVAESFITDGGIYMLDDDVILEFTDDNIPQLIDYTVVRAKNAKNINEIGIFRVQTGKQNEMKDLLESYVQKKQSSYRAMDYFPEEVEKIDFATVKVLGNYVIYSFLNETDTHSFYETIESKLIK